jgi:hypothetical protein
MTEQIEVKVVDGWAVGTEWDDFVDRSDQATVFAKSHWLRATTDGHFSVVVCRDEAGVIVAGMPIYYRVTKARVRCIIMPRFTQVLGPLLVRDSSLMPHQKVSREVSRVGAMLAALPAHSVFNVTLHPKFGNVLPFIWRNYNVRVGYTYRLGDLSDLAGIRERYADIRRREIRRAGKKYSLRENISPEEFYKFQCTAREGEGQKLRFSWKEYSSLALHASCAVKTLAVVTTDGRVVAATALAWDSTCCYYLLPGVLASERKSGCVAFLIDQAIEWASQHSRAFDFEGSSTFGIEEYYRYFGAELVPVYCVQRDSRSTPARLLEWGLGAVRRAVALKGRFR